MRAFVEFGTPARENLDTTYVALRMFTLCEETIERETIAKLNGSF